MTNATPTSKCIAEANRTLGESIAKSKEAMLKSAAQMIRRKQNRNQRVSDKPNK